MIVLHRFVAVCAFVILCGAASEALAWTHGLPPPSALNFARATINVNPGYANWSKAMAWLVKNNNCASAPCANSDGYPNQKLTSNVTVNSAFQAGYYGTITWSWSGTGSMQDNTSNPAIFTSISPSGAVFEMGAVTSGDHAPATYCFCSQSPSAGLSNPTIVFQYGWNVQSIQNDGSGHIQINTKTNYVNSKCWGTSGPDQFGNIGQLVNISGAATNTGANGTWIMTTCGASSFVLQGSTFTNAQASVQGTAIFAGQNLSLNINNNSNTWTGFGNIVIAKTADVQAGGQIANGHYWDTTYVNQLQTLMNPNGVCATNRSCGWLRFMDWSGTEENWEQDFSQRIPTTAISFATKVWYPAGYSVGTITNGSGTGCASADQYCATDPSISTWNGSSYIDGAIVQGSPSATNSTTAPTLNVGGHGAKPILDDVGSLSPLEILINNAPSSPGTSAFTFTFTAGGASWLNGGSSCVGTYTTQAGDTTVTQLAADLTTWIAGGTVGANTPLACLASSGVFFGNGGLGPYLYIPTAQAGKLLVSYSSTSDPTIFSPGTMTTSYISSGAANLVTFKYNYLLDAWMYISGEFVFSPPVEVAADLANQVGANVWWNFNFNSAGYVQSVVQNFASNLNTGLKFGFEQGNENWDCFGPKPCEEYKMLGVALGMSPSSNEAMYGYAGLRMTQFASVGRPAWTGAGRLTSDFYVLAMTQAANEGANGGWDQAQLQGKLLATTNTCHTKNTFVASYGALGGGAPAVDYGCAPNRPVDTTNAIGLAPYWGSPWWGDTSSALVGTVSGNAPWLQAQLDYANGLTSQAFSEITNTFNGTTVRTDGNTNVGQLMLNAGSGNQNITTMHASLEAIAEEYDCSPVPNCTRSSGGLPPLAIMDYEGAPQWGWLNSNPEGGTNSPTDATSLANLTSQITALGWNVSAYTFDGTNTASELAQQIITFAQAWKNSSTYGTMIYNAYYQALQTESGSKREIHPAQYGYSANTWGLFPFDYHYGNNYGNFTGIANWNSGR